ncbi:MAG TPA: ParB-like protein, partial [Rhizomicrobium sp.]|nr:ParB-like protein [Rhizomicrobium sp.]
MTKPNEPILTSVAIADLKPTQITVGMREVEIKRKLWQAKSPKKGERFLGQHMVPTILGPKGHHYIIDHHHLARALHDEGVKDVLVRPLADLGRLETSAFWAVMDMRDWVHPYDDKGKRRGFGDIPKSVAKLVDDPFRSLAGELRRVG